jgi:hypothetical protein
MTQADETISLPDTEIRPTVRIRDKSWTETLVMDVKTLQQVVRQERRDTWTVVGDKLFQTETIQ